MENVNFRNSEVYNASFSIIPKYGQIDLYMRDLNIGPAGEPVTNITISMDVPKNDIIRTPINSNFIGTDIARTADIPTKTSQLTNDSNFIASDSLATVATSGSYNDLTDKPTIPTKTSQLTNDRGFIDGTLLSTVAFSGNYNDLTDKPLLDYKSDIIKDDSNVLKTVYGGYHVVFKNTNNLGAIIDNTVDLGLPALTWGTYGDYTEYAHTDSAISEACYKC